MLRIAGWATGCLMGVVMLTGCGSKPAPPPEQPATTEQPTTSAPAESSGTASTSSAGTNSNTGTGNSNRKFVDGIPYDVFYDRPLTIAAQNDAPVPSAMQMGSSPTTEMASSNASPAPTTTPAATPVATPGGAAVAVGDWDKIMPKPLLISEVMRLRNSLAGNLNSVGNFNRELLVIQADAAVLAALAGIASQHNEDFTWKTNAKYVRDLASEIATAAETRGRPAFESAEKPFLNIVEILDGGTPAELPNSDDETTFSDVAERNKLMKQVQANSDWLQTTISSENELKSKKEEIISRASILAAIGQVIHHEDYVFADEADYQSFCQMLIEGSLKMTTSAQDENFNEFKLGFDLMKKSCNDCHPQYLNN